MRQKARDRACDHETDRDQKNELVDGEIWLHAENLIPKSDRAMQHIRGHKMAMIFQDPMTSLNPLYTVGDQIAEVPILHEGLPKKTSLSARSRHVRDRAYPLPKNALNNIRHLNSARRMRQRVIAMNLACKPEPGSPMNPPPPWM